MQVNNVRLNTINKSYEKSKNIIDSERFDVKTDNVPLENKKVIRDIKDKIPPEEVDEYLDELSQKYDFNNMTTDEMKDFIEEIYFRGILSSKEIDSLFIVYAVRRIEECYSNEHFGSPIGVKNYNLAKEIKKIYEISLPYAVTPEMRKRLDDDLKYGLSALDRLTKSHAGFREPKNSKSINNVSNDRNNNISDKIRKNQEKKMQEIREKYEELARLNYFNIFDDKNKISKDNDFHKKLLNNYKL